MARRRNNQEDAGPKIPVQRNGGKRARRSEARQKAERRDAERKAAREAAKAIPAQRADRIGLRRV